MAETRRCSVEGCVRRAWAKGWCHTHYYQLRPMPDCSIEGCSNPSYKRGWCNAHYQRWRNNGDPLVLKTRPKQSCSIEGCEKGAHGAGLCNTHYMRMMRTGTTEYIKEPKPLTDPESKVCTRCNQEKHRSEFTKANYSRDGLGWCKECSKERQRELWEAKPDHMRQLYRARHLARYGLTIEQFDALLAKQNGKCAICSGEPNGRGGYHIDHDHSCCPSGRSCGKCVRGLLCSRCNLILGKAQDSPQILEAAIQYLERG